jgi:hypothetical protein
MIRPFGVAGLFFLSLITLNGAGAPTWPQIKPILRGFHFGVPAQAKLNLAIEDRAGKPLYILDCYAFQAAPATGDFAYSGDFECRLHSADNKDYESTLLTELPNADADWESRGRFLVEQLAPPCGDYENLGRDRTFRLRGFKLELKLSEISLDPRRRSFSGMGPALKSFDLEVIATPDLAATSAIASTPTVPRRDTLPEPCRSAFDTLYLDQIRRR